MKDIPEYEGLYAATEDGQIWTHDKIYGQQATYKGRFMKQSIDAHGYRVLNLYKNKKKRCYKVHQLIAKTFIENPLNLWAINHIDGDKLNNRVENLEWCTLTENNRHAIAMNLNRRGKNGRFEKVQ